jgi:hypothetical protein
MAAREEVVGFLNLFKSCIVLNRLAVKDRAKNRQALIHLGITPDQRRDILLGLVPEDYVAGPKPDDTDDTKEVWEFGRDVEATEVYIKLRVVQDPRKKGVYRAMVWSFHPAEHPMNYPLRGGAR